MKKVLIVIPARYASTRLPGKPLLDIIGKPMIQHVVERAQQVAGIAGVLVATDDERVARAVTEFGGSAMMTSAEHQSGTDRLVEVMQKFPSDVYINVQGDEPLIRPQDLELLITAMNAPETEVATLCHAIDADEAANPNAVKVVINQAKDALYFSRAAIPFPRHGEQARYLKHVGVYAYKKEVLDRYSDLARPMTELTESLEQLRLLDAGINIKVLEVAPTGPGVDTVEDLERVRLMMSGHSTDMANTSAKPDLARIKLVITDVDGVLTDGGIYYDATGECLKRFHVRDGLGIKMLEDLGVRVAVLSGRDSPTLRKRVADLGITLFRFGVKDKAAACQEFMAALNITKEQTACIGDDSIDLPAFKACGLSFAVADSADYVKKNATATLSLPGGKGAFRELSDAILTAQGHEAILSTADGYAKVMENMVQ